jgi:hypothetical protein
MRNHGLITLDNGLPAFRFGIMSVFGSLALPPFVFSSGKKVRSQVRSYWVPSEAFQALNLHVGNTLHRLLHSLDVFQRKMATIGEDFTEGCTNPDGVNEQLYAAIAADSILYYLNILVDDLARMIPSVIFDNKHQRDRKDFYDLKKDIKRKINRPEYAPIRPLFLMLDDPLSWWSLGFQPETGMRQRIVHFLDFVTIQGSQNEGESNVTSRAYLINFLDMKSTIPFEKRLRHGLRGLCDWLDQLEQPLWDRLSERARMMGKADFARPKQIYQVRLPVELPLKPRSLPTDNFLYLPSVQEP